MITFMIRITIGPNKIRQYFKNIGHPNYPQKKEVDEVVIFFFEERIHKCFFDDEENLIYDQDYTEREDLEEYSLDEIPKQSESLFYALEYEEGEDEHDYPVVGCTKIPFNLATQLINLLQNME